MNSRRQGESGGVRGQLWPAWGMWGGGWSPQQPEHLCLGAEASGKHLKDPSPWTVVLGGKWHLWLAGAPADVKVVWAALLKVAHSFRSFCLLSVLQAHRNPGRGSGGEAKLFSTHCSSP